jgi:hypothetical protein
VAPAGGLGAVQASATELLVSACSVRPVGAGGTCPAGVLTASGMLFAEVPALSVAVTVKL